MRTISHRSGAGLLIATLALPLSAGLNAQTPEAAPANIVVNAERPPAVAEMTAGPEIKGVITARSGDRMKVTAADGTSTVITLIDATRIKSSSGLFNGSRGNLGADSLQAWLIAPPRRLRVGVRVPGFPLPWGAGGAQSLRNCAVSCWKCNNERGDMPFEAFRAMKSETEATA